MRTTVNIDERLLAEAKLIAARSHRSVGSVLEDALRALLEAQREASSDVGRVRLPTFTPDDPRLRPGVDLEERAALDDLLDAEGPFRALP